MNRPPQIPKGVNAETWLSNQEWFFDAYVYKSGCSCCACENIHVLAKDASHVLGLVEWVYHGEEKNGVYNFRAGELGQGDPTFTNICKMDKDGNFLYHENMTCWQNKSIRFLEEIMPLVESAREIAIENSPIERWIEIEDGRDIHKSLKNSDFWGVGPVEDSPVVVKYDFDSHRFIKHNHWDPYDIVGTDKYEPIYTTKLHRCKFEKTF